MINGKRVLAIIPARGGSKRLPKKNLLELSGKPLIAWTIEAAKNSKYIDNVVVSTDCELIAATSELYGIKVPELRPSELSDDESTTQSVVAHNVHLYGKSTDYVVLLQPTSPLRTAEDIDAALDKMLEKNAYSIVSVSQCEHPPLWSNVIPPSDSMFGFIKAEHATCSQNLGEYFRLNGAIYIYKTQEILKGRGFTYEKDTFAYKMNVMNSVDIDTRLDFDFAEFLVKKYR
ncbi:cytidylyltransferase domain-containing protein [Vibrio astriarenae]